MTYFSQADRFLVESRRPAAGPTTLTAILLVLMAAMVVEVLVAAALGLPVTPTLFDVLQAGP